ncbi:MAG: serine/threonine-protein kinase [bacterium]
MSRGGMGEIFLAKSGEIQGFEKLFVIKKILPHLSNNAGFTERFVDEAKISINLNHANIVPVFEVGVVGANYFLALEYVEGRDLRRILSRCYECKVAIPPALALMIAREIASGLAYAHRRQDEHGKSLELVHCDISPPNVLISREGEVRIIDFGVSRSANQVSREDPAVGFGKFGYMAPEQILKGRELDQRTDLYALGVVLYEMLVGDRMLVFSENDEYRQIARQIVLGDVEPPSARRPELGRQFDDVVAHAIAKDPGNRFQSAAEFRDELQRLLLDVNPTISADDLAEFLREQFDAELEQEREIIREVKATDVSVYRPQIIDAKEQTVSYAMTDMWSVSTEGFQSVGTAIETGPGLLEPPPEERRSLGWILPVIAGGALLLTVVLIVTLWPKSTPTAHERAGTARALSTDGSAPSLVGADPDASPDVMTRPVMTRVRPRTSPGMRLRPRPMWRPRPRWTMRTMPMPPMRDAAVDDKLKRSVLAKFRRVRGQYARFKQRYGSRLERHWQAILQTAVYSGADRYKRLDRQLDGLSARMAKIRAQAP